MSALDGAHARLDMMIAGTLDALTEHRAEGGTDNEFQAHLAANMRAAATYRHPAAGHTHMALALYRLAVQHQHIEQLAAENQRYRATLADLDALDRLT